MNKGSFSSIYKNTWPPNIDVLGKVALAALEGLTYFYNAHGIVYCSTDGRLSLYSSAGDASTHYPVMGNGLCSASWPSFFSGADVPSLIAQPLNI